jgi:hypothetical protein
MNYIGKMVLLKNLQMVIKHGIRMEDFIEMMAQL